MEEIETRKFWSKTFVRKKGGRCSYALEYCRSLGLCHNKRFLPQVREKYLLQFTYLLINVEPNHHIAKQTTSLNSVCICAVFQLTLTPEVVKCKTYHKPPKLRTVFQNAVFLLSPAVPVVRLLGVTGGCSFAGARECWWSTDTLSGLSFSLC